MKRYWLAILLLVPGAASAQQFQIVSIEPQPFTVVEIVKSAAAQRQWYLVTATWCDKCPAEYDRFIAKGWPESNVLTIEQAKERFGIEVPHVPFQFGEPVKVAVKPVQTTTAMSHGEMVALHNRLHGGGSWTWPGDLATHLRTTHGVSTTKTVTAYQSTSQPAVRVQQSGCPTGQCPVTRSRRNRR